jgi:hypothetical protein
MIPKAPIGVFGHSRGGSGMECRAWIILFFSFSWVVYALVVWFWMMSVQPLTGVFKFLLLSMETDPIINDNGDGDNSNDMALAHELCRECKAMLDSDDESDNVLKNRMKSASHRIFAWTLEEVEGETTAVTLPAVTVRKSTVMESK